MTHVAPQIALQADTAVARHARLFELIRQHNLTARQQSAPGAQGAQAPQHTAREFASAARRSLLPQEQQALGYSASFGR